MYYNYNPADKENRLSVAWLCFICIISIWTAFEAPIALHLGN
jgi:hypothetical protein